MADKILMSKSAVDLALLRATRPPDELRPKTFTSLPTGNVRITADDNSNIGVPVKQAKERRANPEKRKQDRMEHDSGVRADNSGTQLFGNISSDALRRLNAMIANFFMMKDGSISQDINLGAYGIDSGSVITNSVVQELCTVQPNVTRLDLSNCVEISDAGLWAIARHCKKLNKLVLAGCDKITNVGLRSISLACSTITELDFNHCHLLDDIAVTVISTGSWKLKTLSLQDCTGITDTGVGKLAKCSGSLTSLDLSGCSGVGEFGDHALKELGAFCCQLRYLDLTGCRRVEDAGLKSIAVGCPLLERLKASGCQLITRASLLALAKHNKSLQTLALVDCHQLFDNDFSVFHHCDMAASLTDLDLTGCVNLTDKGVAVLIRSLIVSPKILEAEAEVVTELPSRSVKFAEPEPVSPKSPFFKYSASGKYESAKTKARILKAERDAFMAEREAKARRERELALRGCRLVSLSLVGCSLLTDFSSAIIAELCKRLRRLDLSGCSLITDESVHTLAAKVSGLTTLRLDRVPRVTAKALMSHIGSGPGYVDFADLAKQWIGYQPKENVEELMVLKVATTKRTEAAVMIQKSLRGKFARKRFIILKRQYLIATRIPRFQAIVRGVSQRKKFRRVMMRIFRIRCAIKIQNCFRMFAAYRRRMNLIKEKRFLNFKNVVIVNIQRVYRGMKGRERLMDARNKYANYRLVNARLQARKELMAIRIQLNYRAWVARMDVYKRAAEKERLRLRRILEEKMTRRLQRLVRGLFGRRKRDRVLAELALQKKRWLAANTCQRMIRGHAGRKVYKHMLWLREQERRRAAATCIQRHFRGYRGRVLGAVARALALLRRKSTEAAMLIQRITRGHFGRIRAANQRNIVMRWRIERKSSINIQRVFRGHKGREAAVIEKELSLMEGKVKPLLLLLDQLETEEAKLAKVIYRLEYVDHTLEVELHEIEKELDACENSTNKYTDSSRINYTPQRYLTKYLRVRLRDHWEHQKEVFKVKHTELQKRRVEQRELHKQIAATKRELIPLTTGAVVNIKRKRSAMLRKRIRDRDKCVSKIQALWRRSLVRWGHSDPCRDYWIECLDPEQSESKYYFNTWSQETSWKMPLAYQYFCKWRN